MAKKCRKCRAKKTMVSVRGHTRRCPGGGRCRVGSHKRRLKYGRGRRAGWA